MAEWRSRQLRVISLVALLACAPVAVRGATQVRYVDGAIGSDLPGNGTAGAPWQTVGYAHSQIDGTAIDPIELRIAQGTYTGAVAMEPWFDLLGGYQSVTWTRAPVTYVTVLDGFGSFHVVTAASNSRLDGFTITGGAAQGVGDDQDGGGLFCDSKTMVVVANNIFANNNADNNGGGLSALGCDIELRDNLFVGNWTNDPVNPVFGSGGGVRASGSSPASRATVLLDGNVFVDNSAVFGAAFTSNNADVTITRNRFGGNRCEDSTVSAGNAVGVWSNNEWAGNDLLPTGSNMCDVSYLSGGSVIGDSRFVNNTFQGTDCGIEMDIGTLTEHIESVNNIFTDYAVALEELDTMADIVPTSNLFYGNTVDFRDENFTDYAGVNPLQLAVPEALGNAEGDPLFELGASFPWTNAASYDAATSTTLLTDTLGIPGATANGVVGWWVNPDTTQDLVFLVKASASTTLTVWGDASSVAGAADTYRISRLRLTNGSAALDRGSTMHPDLPVDDIEGDLRPGTDGLLDIGVDEADSAFLPPVDTNPPGSKVQGLAVSQASVPFDVPYVASDSEASPLSVQLYYRLGTSGGFTDFGSFTSSPISFTAPLGDGLYQFYTVATDSAFNVEPTPGSPDAETLVVTSFTGSQVYVVPGGAGAINGQDWANAVRTPEEGAIVAGAFAVGEVWVAKGTYTGSLTMVPGVDLYGSFSGSEANLEDRNLTLPTTVLDGFGSFHVVTAASNSRLDGFTITGGAAQGVGDDQDGGGLFCDSKTMVVVANNIFANNNANNNGGGLSALGCDIELRDNLFVGNWTNDPVNPVFGSGGGVRASGSSPASRATVLLDGNVFVDNSAVFGAAFTSNNADVTITRNRFGGNRCEDSTVSAGNAVGVWSNNEWAGNDLLPTGSNMCDVSYLSGGSVIGDSRFVNNTFQGTDCGIEMDIGTLTEHIESVNNIFTDYAVALEELDTMADIVPTSNLFYGNTVDFRDENFTDYAGVNPLQLAVPEALGNAEGDPLLEQGPSSTWTDPTSYDSSTFTTTMKDSSGIAGASADGLAGWWVNPDTTQGRIFLVKESTNTTLTVWGDGTGFTDMGDSYSISNFRLTNGSAALDRGSTMHPDLPVDDIEGDLRPGTDGLLDIGVDEADSAFLPPVDTNPPGSKVQGLAVSQASVPFDVPYVASDSEASPLSVQLYYRLGTSGGFTDFGSFTSSPISFTAPLGDGLYQFYTVATDSAFNVEPTPGSPDAETLVVTSFTGSQVYVVPGGAGAINGQDWANAVRTPEEGAIVAGAFAVGEVWVAQGTYTGPLTMVPGVDLYGSFSGSEANLEDRNLTLPTTVLDGFGSFHVVTAASNSRLDGFTITGGAAQGVGDDQDGGGLFCDSKTMVVVANNIFANNNADNNGGGLSALGCDIELRDNLFVGNWTNDPVNPVFGSGGGVRASGSSPASRATVLLDGNVFVDNSAVFGAAFTSNNADVTITRNRFGGNRCEDSTVSAGNAVGVWSNNEWAGNDLLPTGSNMCDVSYLSGGSVIGDSRFVNNTFQGTDCGIEMDIGTLTEHIESVNNIFTDYAVALEELDTMADIVPTSNLFYGNTVDFKDESFSNYSGAAAVNGAVAGASGNVDGDPSFLGGPTGAWSTGGIYTAASFTTVLTDAGTIAGAAANGLAGTWVNPDITQSRIFRIKESTTTTLTVWGDASTLGLTGMNFAVRDSHIKTISVARNQADLTHPDLPFVDTDGDPRPGPDGLGDIGADEADPPSLGDRAWEDLNGDGIQDPGEPGIVAALIYLFESGGGILDVTFTDASGNYRFSNLTSGTSYFVRFIPPTGYVLSPVDQGSDDSADSDADPVTGNTPPITPDRQIDPFEWDAGMVSSVPCIPPDEAVYLYGMRVSTDGNNYPILDFMDFNQPNQVTGFHIYRSSDAGLAEGLWPLVASDIVDGDEDTGNNQWVDISGDVAPSGVWYYQITAYNHRCPAEGPR